MHNADQQAFYERLCLLAEIWQRDLSKTLLRTYWEAMADLPLEAALAALQTAVRTCTYFPTPAELRTLLDGNPHDQAVLQWYRLRRLTGRGYNEEALQDPLVAACFRALGGRQRFGAWHYEREEKWKMREFCDLYASLARQTAPLSPTELDGQVRRLLAEIREAWDAHRFAAGPEADAEAEDTP